jgi:DNA-binding transcriptional regulator YhcF (GntR family)
MGEKLVKIYHQIQDVAGLKGKTLLAMETKIPSTRAALAADSDENIKLFKEAYTRIVGKPPSE